MKSILFYIPLPDFVAGLGLPDRLPVFGYGVMVLLAFLVTVHLAARRLEALGAPADAAQDIAVSGLLAGILGARLLHLFLYPQLYETFFDFFRIYNGGLVLYGGMFLAPLAVWWKLRRLHVTWDAFLRAFAPPLPLAIGIGRLGCFLNGCCYGRPTDLPWAVHFPEDCPSASAHPGLGLHPSQIYAFFLGLALSLSLYLLAHKMPSFSGLRLFALFMSGYGLIRLVEEHFRGDTPRHVANLFTAGQAMSLFVLFAGVALYTLLTLRKNR